jgi:hypothetical protein
MNADVVVPCSFLTGRQAAGRQHYNHLNTLPMPQVDAEKKSGTSLKAWRKQPGYAQKELTARRQFVPA